MKAKTFVACAFVASALPLSASATMPSGPQGTGFYGAPNAAVPVPQSVPPGYIYPAPYYEPTLAAVPDNSVNRDLIADATALDRDAPRRSARPVEEGRWMLSGPSWATNPPAPAP